MDAGVPLKAPIAGIAMGLVKEGDNYAILTDIAGAEDHYGDMDFKVAGTVNGITALQMDIKITGLTQEIMAEALEQARQARLFILEKMASALPAPREEISVFAPRILTLQIPTDKIRDVIGPGGKMIRSIIERTGVKIDVEDNGTVSIASTDGDAAKKAIQIIEELTEVPEVGKKYLGKVQRIVDFGAFVEIIPGDGWAGSHLGSRRLPRQRRSRRAVRGGSDPGEGHQHRSPGESEAFEESGDSRAGRVTAGASSGAATATRS